MVMKKNTLIVLLTLLHLFSFAQVGINTDKPANYSGLHVSERKDPANANPDRYNGIIIILILC